MAFPPSPILSFARAASEQEARLLASSLVNPEHLFLALLWPEATSDPTILSAYGVTLQRVRVAMHEMATWGGEPLRGALPVGIATERAYEIAERYAEGQPISHSDLLIGVLSVSSPTLERLLIKLGMTRSHLRAAVQQSEARRTPARAAGGLRFDAPPPRAPAPDVVDLRSATDDRGRRLPGDVAPKSLDGRITELSQRVEMLTAEVQRLLDERSAP